MKILVLSPKPPWPPHDGGAVAIMRCIEGLAAGGARVTLLTMKTEKHASHPGISDKIPDFLQRYETVTLDTRIRPLKLLANLIFSREPYDIRRFRTKLFSDTLRSLLLKNDFDIIQCEGILFSYYVDEIRSLTSSPIVLRAHNVEHRIREMMADAATAPVERDYLKNLARRLRKREILATRKFDAIVPISEPDYQWFRSVSPDTPMMLSEAGADVSDPGGQTVNTGLRVGFIGALNWQPNLDAIKWFLTGVWPCVMKSNPDATLHIAGRGANTNVKEWFRSRNVFWEGEVDDSRRYMASMTVIIAPLFAGSGLRIKIIEAMSLGKTVVATPVAARGLPVEDKRDILIGSDARTFCDALNSALGDPELRAETGAKARELVKNRFDNLANTAQLLTFYKELRDGR